MRRLLPMAAVLIAGCASLNPISPQTTIEGRQVSQVALQVEQPFTFRPALYSLTMPSGRYLPAFEDASGVYFRSEQQITASTIIGGQVRDGGLYVSKDSWSSVQAYTTDGSASKWTIDVPFQVRIVPR